MSQDDRGTNTDLSALVLVVTHELLAELRAGTVVDVRLNSALDRDLGLDSLARVELFARLERRVGCSLPEGIFGEVVTLSDVVQALARAAPKRELLKPASTPVAPLASTNELPSAAATLVAVLQWHVERHPERPHICLYDDIGSGTTITFAQLRQQAKRIAGELQRRGVKPGEAVALMLPTSAEYFFVFLALRWQVRCSRRC